MTEQTARQAKQARIAELAKTAKLFPTQPDAIAWVIDHRLPEIDAQAIFLANDIEPEGQWTAIEALQKAEAEAEAAKGGTITKRRLIEEEPEREPEPAPEAFFSDRVQPTDAKTEATQSKAARPEWADADWDEPVAPAKPKVVRFHPSDEIAVEEPPTIEQKNRALEVLADLRGTDPLEYAGKRHEWAKRLSTTVVAIDQAVKLVLDAREDDGEQSQATQLVAIGVNKERSRLWCSPEGEPYATVAVDDHRENYRIDGTTYDQWLHYEFGLQYRVKQLNGEYTPKAPGEGAVRDAIKQLKGIASYSKLVFSPVHRVGGNDKVIWIDLGGDDWRAVRVSAEGWRVVSDPGVAFVRTGTMLPLPDPVRGGSIDHCAS